MSHRKRLRRYEVPTHARYLTCSCYHRLPLFQNDSIKCAFKDQLTLTHHRLGFRLLAWVVMPEHVHLLIQPGELDITVSRVLSSLKRPLARKVLNRWRELDAPILKRLEDKQGRTHFWQPGGGYDRNIFSDRELLEKTAYIHANPIRRGLVKKACDWPWSSAGSCQSTRAIEL